ncbi:hypothetical protein RWH44_13740 [Microbacterium sp. KSW2-29]|uniref:Tetratrico peptide repeat group 5 domain-containing protein n=1 Tax=Microbacterium phycohabitans TaxID=3075993 RepID=A0ABU3SPH9_9MICO|nr:hypothetical protein [Microbacterium sp. KSW2-29]MDU0346760.1 hypothetical protein [Microbacterium sp. KSW2-29]
MASALALADLADRRADVRAARQLLSLGNFAPADTSELSSELATLEMFSGKKARARQLFVTSLLQPNENTLAQARWAEDEYRLDLDLQRNVIDEAYEAKLRSDAKAGLWSDAYVAGVLWQQDQSFSQAAALSTSFVASVGLEDYNAALGAAEIGLMSSPHDGGLRNNAAFAAAQLGRLAEAEAHLAAATVDNDADQVHTVEATRGLISFRRGDAETGRHLYRSALDGFRSLRLPYQGVMALLHWAMEEERVGSVHARELLEAAQQVVDRYPTAEGALLLQRLKSRMEAHSLKVDTVPGT